MITTGRRRPRRVRLDHSPLTAASAVPPAGAAQIPSAGGYGPPSVPPVDGGPR